MQISKTKILILIFILALVAASLFVYFKYFNNNTIEKNAIVAVDSGYDKSKQDQEFLKLEERFVKNNSMDVFRGFDALAAKETDLSKQAVIKLYAAASLAGLDKNAGVEYYMDIANDEKYKTISRGYAMIRITQFATAESRPELLKPFLPENYDTKGKNQDDLLYLAHKKIYEIHPYGISAARIARYELRQNPSTTTAQTLYDTYKNPIDRNIREMLPYPDLNHLVPNTLLGTAVFYQDLLKYGITTEEEVVKTFEDAYKTANQFSPNVTREFVLITYAEFYARYNNLEKTKLILRLFGQKPASETFKVYLNSAQAKIDNEALVKLSKKDFEVGEVFKNYNW